MSESITCPLCAGPVALTEGVRALCHDCHGMTDEEMAAEIQKRVDRTIWVALRAIEDQAAYYRLQQQRGQEPPKQYEATLQAAEMLGDILRKTKSTG